MKYCKFHPNGCVSDGIHPMNQPHIEIEHKKMIKDVAEKICELTGYGSALHVNDILPDLTSLFEQGKEVQKEEIISVLEASKISWKHPLDPASKYAGAVNTVLDHAIEKIK